jgi:hypothetical protein
MNINEYDEVHAVDVPGPQVVRHRCPACRTFVEPDLDGDYMVSHCCDEVTERVYMCMVCEFAEAYDGCEECLECIADEAIDDPNTLIACTRSVIEAVSKVLAKRLKPYLRQRQAA